jgi:hypothetical protein
MILSPSTTIEGTAVVSSGLQSDVTNTIPKFDGTGSAPIRKLSEVSEYLCSVTGTSEVTEREEVYERESRYQSARMVEVLREVYRWDWVGRRRVIARRIFMMIVLQS